MTSVKKKSRQRDVYKRQVITLAPTRVNWLITLPTEVPLPGIGLDENSTVSPGIISVSYTHLDFSHYHGLGPEPFDEAFNASYIHAYRKGKDVYKRQIRRGSKWYS